MNKNQVEGRAEQAKGKIKELAGKMVGNQRLQGEGLAEQAEGKARAAYGNAKEAVKDGIKRTADKL
ncbi:CsbD family protein [Xylophilus sp. GW821-FHT01B05]